MRFSLRFIMTAGASAMLAACATAPSHPTISTTVAVTSTPSPQKILRDGGAATDLSVVGQPAPTFHTLLSVRECVAGKCTAGIAKPTIAVTVQRVSEGQATIRFMVTMDIAGSQTLRSQTSQATSEVTLSVPSGATPITDQFAVDRVATIKVGSAGTGIPTCSTSTLTNTSHRPYCARIELSSCTRTAGRTHRATHGRESGRVSTRRAIERRRTAGIDA